MRLLLVSMLAMFVCHDAVAADAKPKLRYMIVPEQAQAAETIQGVVDVLMQLNEDQAYTYDRAELNRMMDDAAAKVRGTR